MAADDCDSAAADAGVAAGSAVVFAVVIVLAIGAGVFVFVLINEQADVTANVIDNKRVRVEIVLFIF